MYIFPSLPFRRIFIIACFLAVLMSACRDNSVYTRFTAVPDQHWGYSDTLRHTISKVDSLGLYDIMIMVRFKKDYEFSNLWLKIRHDLYGKDTTERVEIALFHPDGRPIGKVFGNNSTVEGTWMKGVKLTDTLNIALVQNMRKDPLSGIMDVGIKIVPASQQPQ